MNRIARVSLLLVAIALGGLLADTALAGCRCRSAACGKVCKVVETTREITVTCYGCECDEVAIPGRAEKCRTHGDCDETCDCCAGTCGCTQPCECKCDHEPLCKVRWTEWIPGCATAKSRKTLVKYELTKEVPSYKWEVVSGCECDGVPACALKPAPEGAQLGQSFPLSETELVEYTQQLPAAVEAEATRVAAGKAKKPLATGLFKLFSR